MNREFYTHEKTTGFNTCKKVPNLQKSLHYEGKIKIALKHFSLTISADTSNRGNRILSTLL